MSSSDPTHQTVRLPAPVLGALADRCGELGEDGITALREAGRVAGQALSARVQSASDPAAAAPEDFWETLGQEFVDLGLGPFTYEVRAPGIGQVRLDGLPEADGAEGEPRRRTGCPFATGLLAGLLTGIAGEPVSVLEVECRANGAASCRFLVGDRPRLTRLRDRLANGERLAEVLREL